MAEYLLSTSEAPSFVISIMKREEGGREEEQEIDRYIWYKIFLNVVISDSLKFALVTPGITNILQLPKHHSHEDLFFLTDNACVSQAGSGSVTSSSGIWGEGTALIWNDATFVLEDAEKAVATQA